MAQMEAIDLIINTAESAKSLKDVKTSLKEIKNAMLEAGQGTEEFNRLGAAAGELKDRVDDANGAIKATNPNKFQSLATFAASAAGGVSAITGAMGLFGAQSEEVTKTLAKVQSAMALSQGLAALSEMPKAWGAFKTSAVSALNAVKAGIGATGIGLIVIALGTIYAYWDDIKGAVIGVSEEQNKLNKASDENLKIQQKKLDAIGGQDNILKLQGKSEKDILKLKISQTDETIKAAEISILQAEQTKASQIEASKRNKQILEGIIMFVTSPLQLLLGAIDLAGKAFGQDFGLREGFTSTIAKFVFDPDEVEKNANESITKAKEGLAKLKNDRAGFQLAINAIDKTAKDKSIADAKAISDEKLKIKEDELKGLKELADKSVDEEIKAQQEEEIRLAKTAQERLRILFERDQEELKALGKKHITQSEEDIKIRSSVQTRLILNQSKFNDELAALDKADRDKKFADLLSDQEKIISDSATTLEQKLAALDIENDAIIASTDMLLEDKIIKLEENEKRQVEITKKANLDKLNSGLDLAKQGLASIQAVTDVAFEAKLKKVKKGSKEEEKLMRQQFKLNKAMQLAGAIVDGTKAALTSLASAPVAIGVVPNPVGIAALAFTVATSLANIAKIAATQFDTTSVGGGENNTPDLSSGGNMDAINTSPNGIQPSTQLDENGNVISNQNNNQQPIQAYMVESQATSVHNNVAMIESSMTFHAPALNPL